MLVRVRNSNQEGRTCTCSTCASHPCLLANMWLPIYPMLMEFSLKDYINYHSNIRFIKIDSRDFCTITKKKKKKWFQTFELSYQCQTTVYEAWTTRCIWPHRSLSIWNSSWAMSTLIRFENGSFSLRFGFSSLRRHFCQEKLSFLSSLKWKAVWNL